MSQANLDQINWTNEYSGAGVLLGRIDGWPMVSHPEFAGGGRLEIQNRFNTSYRQVSWNVFHGTACAGVTVGANIGVARGAKLIVTPTWGPTDRSLNTLTNLNASLSYFVSRGCKAVLREVDAARAPWGFEAIWGTGALDLVAKYPQMVNVQPAGNQGLKIGSQPTERPASDFGHLLIVGSVLRNGTRYSNSNYPGGRGMYSKADTAAGKLRPEKLLSNFFVCAPGQQIRSPVPTDGYIRDPDGYMDIWATSPGSAHVDGMVALMYEKAAKVGMDLTPVRCATIIKETCTPLGDKEIYGHGMINVKAALERVV